MSRYLDYFLNLKCSGDVLNVVYPLGNKGAKEITESMAIIQRLKKIVIPEPMRYTIFDLCAGNALTSVLSVFLLPVKSAIAIDKEPRDRKWYLAKRFYYINMDIFDIPYETFDKNSIIIGVHACTKLAKRIVDLYINSKASHLLLMPCCIGEVKNNYPQIIRELIGKYLIWCWQLSEQAGGKFIVDNHILSPKNAIIIAKKGE